MRANVGAARDGGLHVAFLGSNAVFWQIRLEPSAVSGQPHRTVVGYKYRNPDQSGATGDPFATDADPGNNQFVTVQWRDPALGRSEESLIGESPYAAGPSTLLSHMTAYDVAPNGATVFATGTMVWGWGLDDYNKEMTGRVDPSIHRPTQESLANPQARWMTRNVLARFSGLPCPSAGETVFVEDGLSQGIHRLYFNSAADPLVVNAGD